MLLRYYGRATEVEYKEVVKKAFRGKQVTGGPGDLVD